MTIYSELLDLGYTDEQIREAAKRSQYRVGPRNATIAIQDTPDGVPLVGIYYQCDYRTEEEMGVGALRKSINSGNQSAKVQVQEDGAVVFGVREIENTYNLPYQLKAAKDSYEAALPYAQGSAERDLRWKKVNELRQYAKDNGVSLKGLRTKADILNACILTASREHPDVWPAWFHHGNVLILRPGQGLFKDVLELLVQSSIDDNLAISNAGRVFSSGLGFYDKSDVGPKLQAEWDEETAFTKHHEELLEPVKKELEAKGHKWFYLGGPKLISTQKGEPEQVKYWLNGYRIRGSQPYGWYTLEELRSEKFMEDHEAGVKAKDADKAKGIVSW